MASAYTGDRLATLRSILDSRCPSSMTTASRGCRECKAVKAPMGSFLGDNSSKRMAVRAVPRMDVEVSMGGSLTLP